MMRGSRRGLQLGRRGAAAIEYVIIMPVFLTIVFGTIEMGRLMWYQISLQRATAVAARCAGVGTSGCVTSAQIQSKAASSAPGLALAASVFTVNTDASCGVQVTGNLQFQFILSYLRLPTLTLTSTVCHPKVN